MKKNSPSRNTTNEESRQRIPDLDIIDLDTDYTAEFEASEASQPYRQQEPENDDFDLEENWENAGGQKTARHFLSRINMHIVLLVVAVIFVAGIVHRFTNWGEFVDLDEIFKDGQGTYENTMDYMLPLITPEGDPVYMNYGEDSTILFLGNAPLADDRDSEDNLVNMIQEMTGATVYNCSVSDSYLAARWPLLSLDDCPSDIFNFYWLCTLAVGNAIDESFLRGIEVLGDEAPPEAMYIYNTLKTVDLNTVDVIAIMYDASDYFAGHDVLNVANYTDIMQFTGSLEAGIELIGDNYPNIRFIVMSPTYAYGIDENGEYISSDIQRYGTDVLSTYAIRQADSCVSRSVTFIDNLYGTITQDNADDYLVDHLHLNLEGRKKVAQRFVDALNYFKVE